VSTTDSTAGPTAVGLEHGKDQCNYKPLGKRIPIRHIKRK